MSKRRREGWRQNVPLRLRLCDRGRSVKDYLAILLKNAGMPAAFDKDLKYAYTSKNFLEVLKAIRVLIDDGSMPKEPHRSMPGSAGICS